MLHSALPSQSPHHSLTVHASARAEAILCTHTHTRGDTASWCSRDMAALLTKALAGLPSLPGGSQGAIPPSLIQPGGSNVLPSEYDPASAASIIPDDSSLADLWRLYTCTLYDDVAAVGAMSPPASCPATPRRLSRTQKSFLGRQLSKSVVRLVST